MRLHPPWPPDEERLETRTLAQIALIAFHQPPAELHHPLPDCGTPEEPGQPADIPDAHPQAAAALPGHARTPAARAFAAGAPSVKPGRQLDPAHARQGDQTADHHQPSGPGLHTLSDDGA
ncbi:hypothetical protein [Streptomyces longisporoflavus]|uniref:hypothetical protein n=1 Tax=Streptomyces longisporoflavus TaxID=28044 RepID=UPI001E32E62F|nr:hypothetical protein [Streptomyces longisporoflavus]